MKIALISFYSGSVNRGVETVVHELASRLSPKHQVTVLQEGPPKLGVNYKVIQIPMNIDWERKEMTGTISRRLFGDYWSRLIAAHTLKCLAIVWREKYDIIVPLNGGWQPALIRLATWLYGGKMVCSGQSGMGWDDRNNLWSFPNAFVALSQKALAWARKANPILSNIKYIPNGVDLNKFCPHGEKYKTRLKKPVILCVGAFTTQKRLDLVIRAVSGIEEASLLLVGSGGELEKSLGKLGQKLLGERFELVKSSYEQMPSIYRSADLFTLVPATREAFGIVYVEALASNLPVVAINDEQRRDIIGDAGILVGPENLGEYRKALERALNKQWRDKPRNQAKKFDWDKIAGEYETLFRSLIK